MDYKAMGRRIRMKRKEQGFTQAELAEQVGISTSFMGHIERGTRIASVDTLVRLSAIMKVSIDALITGLDPLPTEPGQATSKMRTLNDMMRVLNEHSDEWLRDD